MTSFMEQTWIAGLALKTNVDIINFYSEDIPTAVPSSFKTH